MDPQRRPSWSPFFNAECAVAVHSRPTLNCMSYALVLTEERHLHKGHCCGEMSEQANLIYPAAESALLGSTDKRIYWSSAFDEYGLICQPSAEIMVISHCPFCGSRLPQSQRAAWMDRLETTGWRTWDDPIPSEFLSGEWRAI